MKKLTGTPKRCVFRVLLILLIVAMTATGCAFGTQTPEPTEEPTKPTSKYNNPMDLPEDMLDAIVDYLQSLNMEYDMPSTSVEIKIDKIKNGSQPLHVAFDSESSYFVCGYYNDAHKSETSEHCCAEEYTWIKFENANKIQESFDGKKMIVAFQINKALFVRDISQENTSIPEMEHFQMYECEFIDGINTNEPAVFDETFIYLNKSSKSVVYHNMAIYYHNWVAFPCIDLDSQYYIPIRLSVTYPSGNISQFNLTYDFGNYHDALMDILVTGKYSVTYETGAVASYGLLEVNEFANAVLK